MLSGEYKAFSAISEQPHHGRKVSLEKEHQK
jgi:hypothetical protein